MNVFPDLPMNKLATRKALVGGPKTFLLLTNWGVGGWLGQRGPINVKQSRKEEWNYPLVSVSPSVTQPSRACWFGDGYFFVWTNTFGNLDKHLWVYLLLGVLVWHSLPEHADLVMDVFIIWKNAFCVSTFIPWLCSNKWENRKNAFGSLDKYVWVFLQVWHSLPEHADSVMGHFYLDKYIWQFGQIFVSVSPSVAQPSQACWFGDGCFFLIWTNTIVNLDKYLWVYLIVWQSSPKHADSVMDVSRSATVMNRTHVSEMIHFLPFGW